MLEALFGVFSTFTRSLPHFRGKQRIGEIITDKVFRPTRFKHPIRQVSMKDGSHMLLDARTRMELGAFWSGLYEPHVSKKLIGFVEKNDSILDIGANIGFISMAIGKRFKELQGGHIYAFEPVPSNYERLTKVRDLNNLTSIMTTYQMALGTEDGELKMAMEQGGSSGNAVQGSAVEGLNRGDKWEFSTVPMRRLDDIWEADACPDIKLIKIDVEGAELFVFQGGQECLASCQPVIFAEFNSFWMKQSGYDKKEVMALPCFSEYEYFYLNRNGTIAPLVGEWSDMGDVVMIPKSLSPERRAKLLGTGRG